ncbi:MAG: dTDP-4-dehydrorhamnose 3,5-epimerase [Elusimicrobia bacterium]|nr:MAG: dTDP-4-dehydrorhamnose 3,5-epimerase [Elusimicrobiota bacterium]
MNVLPTALPGVLIVEPQVWRDPRGYFLESFHARKAAAKGLPESFVQDNESYSQRGTVRGLHSQLTKPQGKLVRILAGVVLDVAVDIRRGSPTFGRWVAVELSEENFRQLYIPPGFAHGFSVLSETAKMAYKCTDFYDASDEIGILWSDPALAIDWRVADPVLSKKDAVYPTLAQAPKLPEFRP